MSIRPRLMGLALLLAGTTVAAVAGAATITAVALKGDVTPTPNVFYRRFGAPAVADWGGGAFLAFEARARPATGRQKRCLYKVDETGTGTTVACVGDTTPDGHEFRRFQAPDVNSADDVAFASLVSQGRMGVYRGDPTIVSLLGDSFPGTGLLEDFSSAHNRNSDDLVAYKATISGGLVVGGVTIDEGIFACVGGDGNCSAGGTGTLLTVALVNAPVTDRPGRKICSFGDIDIGTAVVFRASTKLDCADGGEAPLEGVFVTDGAVIDTIALQGEAAEPFPGPGGTTYDKFVGPPSITSGAIDIAFQAVTAGIVKETVQYLWTTGPTAAAAVVQGQDDGNGNVIRKMSPPTISDADDIAFTAVGRGNGVTRGVYIKRAAGGIETVALKGDASPGPGTFRGFGDAAISAGGRVAFRATIKASTPPTKREGIFLYQP
jgi:hypothetical protein